MATLAFCGLGVMGAPMATRLATAGHQVRVWNRTPERARKRPVVFSTNWSVVRLAATDPVPLIATVWIVLATL